MRAANPAAARYRKIGFPAMAEPLVFEFESRGFDAVKRQLESLGPAGKAALGELDRAQERAAGGAAAYAAALAAVQARMGAAASANENAVRALGAVSAAAGGVTAQMGGAGTAVSAAAGLVSGATAAWGALTASLVSVGAASTTAAKSHEKIMSSLGQATGSAAAAAKEYDFVRSSAQKLGLDLAESAAQYGKLAAAARGTSLEGETARQVFIGVAQGATALKLSADETGGALNAVQQMISKGKVQAEELRGQLGERLPGAFQIAARAMGVTTQALDKMLEGGEVYTNDFLPKFAKELQKTFGEQAGKSANSLQAELNRLKNAVFETGVAIGDGGLSSGVAAAARMMTGAASAAAPLGRELGAVLGAAARAAGDAVKWAADNARLLGDVIGFAVAVRGGVLLTELGVAAKGASVWFGALAAAMAANPIAVAAGVVAGTAYAVYSLYQRSQEAAAAATALATAQADVNRLSGLSVDAFRGQTAEMQANTLAAAKNAEAKLSIAAADAQTAALRAAGDLDTQKAMFPNVRTPGVVDAEKAAERTAAAAALAVKNWQEAQDVLTKFSAAAAGAAKPTAAAALATEAAAASTAAYEKAIKGLHPVVEAAKERDQKRLVVMAALDAGLIGTAKAQSDLTAINREYADAVEKANRKLSDGEKAAVKDAKAHEAGVDAVEDYIAKLKGESEGLEMTDRARAVYAAGLEVERIAKGRLNDNETAKYIEQAKEEAAAVYDAKEAREEAKKAAKEYADTVKKTTDDVVKYSADAFADMVGNGKKSWKDLFDSIEKWAIQTAARIAAEMIIRPVVQPVVAGLASTAPGLFGASSAPAAALAGQAQGGGLGGAGQLLSLGSKFVPSSWTSGLTSAVDNFGFQYLGTGLEAASMTPAAASAAWAEQIAILESGAGSGLAGSSSLITGVAPGVEGSLGAASLSSYLGPVGAGAAVGGLVGPMIGKNKYTSALAGAGSGALAGAAYGSVFPIVGTAIGAVIGAIAGAISGFLGGAKNAHPAASVDIAYSDGGASSGQTYSKHMGQEAAAEMGAAAANAINAATSTLLGAGVKYDISNAKVQALGYDQKANHYTVMGLAPDANFEKPEDAVKEMVFRAIKYLPKTGLDANVSAALAHSKATDLEGLTADVQFAKDFSKTLDALSGKFGFVDKTAADATAAAEALAAQIGDFKTRVSDLGLPLDQAAAATRAYVDAMVSADLPAAASQTKTAVDALSAKWRAMGPALEAVGYSADEAAVKLEQGLAANLKRLGDDYQTALGRQINEASGKSYINTAADIQTQYAGVLADLTALGRDGSQAAALASAQLATLFKGLDDAAASGALSALTGDVAGLAAAAWGAEQATRAATTAQEQAAQAAQAAADAAAAEADRVAAVVAAARSERDFNIDLLGRRQSLIGDRNAAATTAFDLAAAQRIEAATAEGRDVAALTGVLSAERAKMVYDQAVADYKDGLSQQAAALEQSAAALKANIDAARGFRDAFDALALSDASPLDAFGRLNESRTQFSAVAAAYQAATDAAEKSRLATQLTALGSRRVELARAYYASSDSADYDAVRGLYAQLGVSANADQTQIEQNQQQLEAIRAAQRSADRIGERQLGSLESLAQNMGGAKATLDAQLAQLAALAAAQNIAPLIRRDWSSAGSDQITAANYALAKSLGVGDATKFLQRADQFGMYRGAYSYAAPSWTNFNEWDQSGDAAALQWLRGKGYGGEYDTNANIYIVANGLSDQFSNYLVEYGNSRGWSRRAYAHGGGVVVNGVWNRDSVSAPWLAGGEVVTRAPAVTAATLPILDYINRTGAPPPVVRSGAGTGGGNAVSPDEMAALRRDLADHARRQIDMIAAAGGETVAALERVLAILRADGAAAALAAAKRSA